MRNPKDPTLPYHPTFGQQPMYPQAAQMPYQMPLSQQPYNPYVPTQPNNIPMQMPTYPQYGQQNPFPQQQYPGQPINQYPGMQPQRAISPNVMIDQGYQRQMEELRRQQMQNVPQPSYYPGYMQQFQQQPQIGGQQFITGDQGKIPRPNSQQQAQGIIPIKNQQLQPLKGSREVPAVTPQPNQIKGSNVVPPTESVSIKPKSPAVAPLEQLKSNQQQIHLQKYQQQMIQYQQQQTKQNQQQQEKFLKEQQQALQTLEAQKRKIQVKTADVAPKTQQPTIPSTKALPEGMPKLIVPQKPPEHMMMKNPVFPIPTPIVQPQMRPPAIVNTPIAPQNMQPSPVKPTVPNQQPTMNLTPKPATNIPQIQPTIQQTPTIQKTPTPTVAPVTPSTKIPSVTPSIPTYDVIKSRLKLTRDRIDALINRQQQQLASVEQLLVKEKERGLPNRKKALYLVKQRRNFTQNVQNLRTRHEVIIRTLSNLTQQNINKQMVDALDQANQYMLEVQQELQRKDWRQVLMDVHLNNKEMQQMTQEMRMGVEEESEVDRMYKQLEAKVMRQQEAKRLKQVQVQPAKPIIKVIDVPAEPIKVTPPLIEEPLLINNSNVPLAVVPPPPSIIQSPMKATKGPVQASNIVHNPSIMSNNAFVSQTPTVSPSQLSKNLPVQPNLPPITNSMFNVQLPMPLAQPLQRITPIESTQTLVSQLKDIKLQLPPSLLHPSVLPSAIHTDNRPVNPSNIQVPPSNTIRPTASRLLPPINQSSIPINQINIPKSPQQISSSLKYSKSSIQNNEDSNSQSQNPKNSNLQIPDLIQPPMFSSNIPLPSAIQHISQPHPSQLTNQLQNNTASFLAQPLPSAHIFGSSIMRDPILMPQSK